MCILPIGTNLKIYADNGIIEFLESATKEEKNEQENCHSRFVQKLAMAKFVSRIVMCLNDEFAVCEKNTKK